MPKGKGNIGMTESKIAPLPAGQYKACLTHAWMLNMVAIKSKFDANNNPIPGTEYEKNETNVWFGFYSGEMMRDYDGETITDDNGMPIPHMLLKGFVTLNPLGKNLIKVFKWIRPKGLVIKKIELGGADKFVTETLEDNEFDIEFGTNGLGDNYEGCDYDQLPYYLPKTRGGVTNLVDVRVPVTRWRMNGVDIFGLWVNLEVSVNDRDFNQIENGMTLNEEPLDKASLMAINSDLVYAPNEITYAQPVNKPTSQPVRNKVAKPAKPVEQSDIEGIDYVVGKKGRVYKDALKDALFAELEKPDTNGETLPEYMRSGWAAGVLQVRNININDLNASQYVTLLRAAKKPYTEFVELVPQSETEAVIDDVIMSLADDPEDEITDESAMNDPDIAALFDGDNEGFDPDEDIPF